MHILFYGINYSPELTGIGKYTGEMAPWFAQQGCQVTVVTAPPYYPEWRVHDGYRNQFAHVQSEGVEVYRCPCYVPKTLTHLKRLIHLSSFALSSLSVMLWQVSRRPDVVVLVVPTLFCALPAWLTARLSGAKAVVHVQDFEVDAMFGLGMSASGLLEKLARKIESWVFRRFDRASTISSGMMHRLQQKGVDEDRVLFFPNWSEVERFQSAEISLSLLERLGVRGGQKVVLYAGNMGEKQGLDLVLELAQAWHDRTDVTFLLVGDGGGKAALQQQAEHLALSNIAFAPLQPYEDLPALLASADVHLVIQKKGVADAVLPSKLTNILAVGGQAVITAEQSTTLGQLCKEHQGIAVCVVPESLEALQEGVDEALSMPRHNKVAQEYAQKFLDKQGVLTNFKQQLEQLCAIG